MSIFIDGSRVTPGTEKCMCDSPTPRPDGQPRDCEFPCWQRLGLTSTPCCPDCAPLEEGGIGDRLRVELARRRWTQRELAERLGYTQTAVSYWCAGKRKPSLDDLCTLADLFETTTDYLLGRTGDAR